jgi:hypothetical protein
MKRTMKLTFTTDEDWATFREAMRRIRKACITSDPLSQPRDADHVAWLCREFLDAPPAAKNGEAKP